MSVSTPAAIGVEPAIRTAPDRPSRRTTSSILVFGNLAWLGWLWAALLVLLPIALLIAAVTDRTLDSSLWAGGGIAWQRWILFAAGIALTRTFLRELVSRGVTRRRFAESAVIAIGTLAVIGAVVGIAGYLIEWAIFRWQGWRMELAQGDAFDAGRIPRLLIEYALLGAVYFLAGWLVGAGYVRFRWIAATLLIPVCFVPAALVELVVSHNTKNFRIDSFPDSLDHPAMLLTLGVAVPVAALTSVVTMRVTRTLPLR